MLRLTSRLPMDSTRRRELQDRRRELQAQIALDERRVLLEHHTPDIDKAGIKYEVVFESNELAEWIMERWPTTSRGVTWSEVANYDCRPEEEGVRALAQDVLVQTGSVPDDEVEVLFSNGLTPALRMCFRDVLTHGNVLASDFEVWVICRRRNWIMEYVSARGWCAGIHTDENG